MVNFCGPRPPRHFPRTSDRLPWQTLIFFVTETGFNIYYLMRPGPKNEAIKAFPKGLRVSPITGCVRAEKC